MNTGKTLLSVLAGIAVGAALGILFAPDKGVNTRKKISKKRDEYTDELEEKFDEFMDTITEKFEDVKDKASSIAQKAKMKVEEMAEKAKIKSDKEVTHSTN